MNSVLADLLRRNLSLTSQDTRIETRKTVIQKLLAEIIIQHLLRAITRLIPRSGRPITLVETERHCFPLCRAL